MVATHHFARYKLGRFLRMAYEQRLFRYIQIVEAESAAAGSITALSQAKWMLVVVCALFFSLLLFDTLGDKRGLQGSYWILIVLPLLPACLYACHLLLPESVGRAGAGAGTGTGGGGGAATTHPNEVELVERDNRPTGSELDDGTRGAALPHEQQQGGKEKETHNALHSKV
ncbi:hypothetical protein B484DRAFT_32791 [Ochromonadaceae sp. CCMP2298]|nr:hypothetical protein B484DRAFT_32791 [Ochromonadaceae sp. CCMP2298]